MSVVVLPLHKEWLDNGVGHFLSGALRFVRHVCVWCLYSRLDSSDAEGQEVGGHGISLDRVQPFILLHLLCRRLASCTITMYDNL